MSFSKKVKNEICEKIYTNSSKHKSICLTAMILNCIDSVTNELKIRTKYDCVIRLFVFLYKEIYGIDLTNRIINEGNFFKLTTNVTRENIQKCLFLKEKINNSKEISLYLSGIYLICGSVMSPEKGYRLELSLNNRAECDFVSENIENYFGLDAKTIERTKDFVVYFNSKESVEDALTMLGASNGTIEIINIEILKDMRNKVNRSVNCDSANIDRTLTSANKQINDIEYIIKVKGIEYLPEKLREVALIRINHPDANLSEISELLDNKISRSGINKRFAKISLLANSIRKTDS